MRKRITRSNSPETAGTGSAVATPASPIECERRQEPRHSISRPVKVTVLGPSGLESDGQLLNLSSRGAAILLDRELPCDSAVRVDIDNALLLGEVRWCLREAASFTVGVSVEHWLPNLQELGKLREKLFGH